MALDEAITQDDVTVDVEGIPFVYSKRLEFYMEDVLIDYTKSWFGHRLVIRSPYGGDC